MHIQNSQRKKSCPKKYPQRYSRAAIRGVLKSPFKFHWRRFSNGFNMKTGETLSEFKQRKNSFFVILIYISSILGLFALHYPSLIFLEIYTYLFLSDFSLKFLLQTSFFCFQLYSLFFCCCLERNESFCESFASQRSRMSFHLMCSRIRIIYIQFFQVIKFKLIINFSCWKRKNRIYET